jgi:hypothetical protein
LGVQAGGGTILEPAYRAALSSLRESPATIKHIILLTDGRLSDGGGPFSTGGGFDFTTMAALARRDGITPPRASPSAAKPTPSGSPPSRARAAGATTKP